MFKTTVTTLFGLFFLLNFVGIHAQNDHHSNHLLIKFDATASNQYIDHLRTQH